MIYYCREAKMPKPKPEVSTILQKKIDEVKAGPRTSVLYDITFMLVSSSNPDIKFDVSKLERIDVVQDFEKDFMDFIDVDFQVTKQQYIQIMKHSEDLQCIIKYYEYDIDAGKRGKLLITDQLLVILRDKKDLYKIFPESQIEANSKEFSLEDRADQRIMVSAQLINKLEYSLIKTRISAILRNVTMKQVIHYLCAQFEIPRLRLVDPDNKKVYANFIIPPMQNIYSVFDWLQKDDGKGVYDKGLSFYVKNEVLFVYPIYETDIKSKRCVHFYKIPNTLESDVSTVGFKNGNLQVLVKDPVSNVDLTDMMIENQGNAILIHHLDKIIPNSYNTPEGFKYNVFESNTTMEILNSKKGIITDVYSPNFRTSAENVHKVRSSIANNELIQMGIHLNHMHYNNFKPADRVEYHYDGDGAIFQTKSGQISSVTTHIVRPIADGVLDLFTMDNEIALSLSNDISKVDTPITMDIKNPDTLIA